MSQVPGYKGRDDYETPLAFFRAVETHLGLEFETDVCATALTSKCGRYFGPDRTPEEERDALSLDWAQCGPSPFWMNPPYGRGISHWVFQARFASLTSTVVGLLPANAWDTRWWHECVLYNGAHELVPIEGRIKFLLDGKVQPAPANGNILAVWRPGVKPAVANILPPMSVR